MSRMKDLYMEVCSLYRTGLAPADIADKLKIPLNWVFGALEIEGIV